MSINLFEQAFKRAFEAECRNSYVSLTAQISYDDSRYIVGERHRGLWQKVPVPSVYAGPAEIMDLAVEVAGALARKVDAHDRAIFGGSNVVEETYEEMVNDTKVKRSRLVRETHSGMLKGMSELEQNIYKGMKDGDWQKGAFEERKAQEEAAAEAERQRQAEFECRQEKERKAKERAAIAAAKRAEKKRLAAEQAAHEQQLAKLAFYDDENFGVF